jgi:hypothetical protein
MPQAAQRKAWNEAMRSAAGVSALPKSLQKTNRRSDRRKRRDKAARSTVATGGGGGHDDDVEYRSAVWLDALEQVNQDDEGEAEQEEEYNELEDLQPNQRKNKRKPKKTKVGQMPKRFKPRSLASILQEETTRYDGVAQAFVEAGRSTTTLPQRPYCPVTGLPGVYREPKSGLCYANDRALEQIRERAPPWRNLTGAAAYNDVVRSILGTADK